MTVLTLRWHLHFFLALLTLFLGAPAPGLTASGTVQGYKVENVRIEVTAEDAATARTESLRLAQRDAFDLLLQNMVPRSQHHRLPVLDDAQLDRLVRSVDVQKEEAGYNQYQGVFTVHFNPEGIQHILQSLSANPVAAPSPPIVILPVLEQQSGPALLWEETNPWREVWLKRGAKSPGVPVIVPMGDLQDISAVKPAALNNLSYQDVATLARRYDVEEVLIASLTPRKDSHRIRLTWLGPVQQGSQALDVPVSGSPDPFTVSMQQVVQALENRVLINHRPDPGISAAPYAPPPLAIDEVMLLIPLSQGIGQWMSIRRRLLAMPEIHRLDILATSPAQIDVRAHMTGSPNLLRDRLAAYGLTLAEEHGYWVLRAGNDRPFGRTR